MKVVLAYSGGLDTSVILHWIKHTYDAEVIAYTADVGQGDLELDAVRSAALKTGASELVVDDLRDSFAQNTIFPALRANAVYEWYYLMGTALARPVIAKGLMDCAARFGAEAIAHGATGKGNDQIRFEMAAYALKPDIKVIAPWREWEYKGRSDLIAYAERNGIDMPAAPKPEYSMDANLMHISYEGGVLEDPWSAPPADMWRMTTNPEESPNEAEEVTILFEQGTPVALDGERLGPVDLIEKLNALAGKHGVGRVDIVENRYLGMKSRGCYETPAVTVLMHAHRAVESLTLDREVQHLRDEMVPKFAQIVYNGLWFSPEREAMQEFMDPSNGESTAKHACAYSRATPRWSAGVRRAILFTMKKIATFEADDVYDQSDATGFIHRKRCA